MTHKYGDLFVDDGVALLAERLEEIADLLRPKEVEWFSPWQLGQLSEVFLTPEQMRVMSLRIRRHFGQPDEQP